MNQHKVPPSPYGFLPDVPPFTVTSNDISEGQTLKAHYLLDGGNTGGQNLSPHLHWEGFPNRTKSFAVTCFDPDAPTGSGFWHWILVDIPASTTELERGAGSGAMEGLPGDAVHAINDFGRTGYAGAAPPAGHGPHRYIFAVHALDVEHLGVDADTPSALVRFEMTAHTAARGIITPIYER